MKIVLTLNPQSRVNLFVREEYQSHHLFDIDPEGLYRYYLRGRPLTGLLDEENKILVEE